MKLHELLKEFLNDEAFELIKDKVEDKEVETIPYGRFKEVNDKKKEYEESLKKFEGLDLEEYEKIKGEYKDLKETVETYKQKEKEQTVKSIFKEFKVKEDYEDFIKFKAGEKIENEEELKNLLNTYKESEEMKKYFDIEEKQDLGFKETKQNKKKIDDDSGDGFKIKIV